jgi:hypothetical protein
MVTGMGQCAAYAVQQGHALGHRHRHHPRRPRMQLHGLPPNWSRDFGVAMASSRLLYDAPSSDEEDGGPPAGAKAKKGTATAAAAYRTGRYGTRRSWEGWQAGAQVCVWRCACGGVPVSVFGRV